MCHAGKLKDNLDITLSKIRSTICPVASQIYKELQKNARLTIVSSTSIIEGGCS